MDKKKKKQKKSASASASDPTEGTPEFLIKPEDVQPSLDTSKWPLLLKVNARSTFFAPRRMPAQITKKRIADWFHNLDLTRAIPYSVSQFSRCFTHIFVRAQNYDKMNVRTGHYTPIPAGHTPLKRPLKEYIKYVLFFPVWPVPSSPIITLAPTCHFFLPIL